MIRFVRTGTLRDLQSQAELVPGLRQRVHELTAASVEHGAQARDAESRAAGARETARTAETRAALAEARYAAVCEDALYQVTQVLDLTRDPGRGEEIRGALALKLMRNSIDGVKESGDEEQIKAIRVFDVLLSEPGQAVEAATHLAADPDPAGADIEGGQ